MAMDNIVRGVRIRNTEVYSCNGCNGVNYGSCIRASYGCFQLRQGVVTSIPTVLTPATGIKMRSSGQAEKLVAIKKVIPCLSINIKAVHRLDSTHFLSSIKDQGFFNGAIKRSRPKISSIKF